jgi:hypothetical protein
LSPLRPDFVKPGCQACSRPGIQLPIEHSSDATSAHNLAGRKRNLA